MSTDVTMQELELETGELLPSRETLGQCGCFFLPVIAVAASASASAVVVI